MKQFASLVLLILCFSAPLSAQGDSLWQAWNNPSNSSEDRLQAIHQVIRSVMFNNPDSALKLAQLEYEFALTVDNKAWEAKAMNTMGVASNFQGDIEGAVKHYQDANLLYTEISDSLGMANTLNNLGIVFDEQGDFANSIEHYKQSMNLRKAMGDKRGVADCLNNIGNVYLEMDHVEDGLQYYLDALEIREELEDAYAVASSYSNLGIAYKRQGDYNKALSTYHHSLDLLEKFNDLQGAAATYYNIGNIWNRKGNEDSAKFYYEVSIDMKRELGDLKSLPVTLNSLADLELKRQNYQDAEVHAREAHKIAKTSGNVYDLSYSSELLSLLADYKGDKATAYDFYKLHIKMRDSLQNTENLKAILNLKLQSEFEKAQLIAEQEAAEVKRIEDEKLARRNSIQYTGIGVGILSLFALIFFVGNLKLPQWVMGLIAFLPLLIFFEFILVLTDPYIEELTGGAPLLKLLANAVMAGAVFPLHAFFESSLKKRLFTT